VQPNALYSGDNIKEGEIFTACGIVRRKKKCVQNFMEKRKQAIGRPEHKFYDIKMDLKETGPEACTGFIWLRICLL
jgi:oligoendopeptidase F